ncbi:hypothetical protein JCM19235_4121 [Vibrio maritimus]|uniref:Uncharacterized protein n=1 Tax=Vibrio maritimus TaxID=990268 RepID=A0A090RXB5_9VIBR|nr:hypothetical protein JCM19235_4121 [Vibrio maritimus]
MLQWIALLAAFSGKNDGLFHNDSPSLESIGALLELLDKLIETVCAH